jgi:hypothetical protein
MPAISKRGLAAALVSVLAGCAGPSKVPAPDYASYNDRLPCVDRIGRCFDASIAGQPVAVIADKQRHDALTAEARRANRAVGDVYWELPQAVDGRDALKVDIRSNALGSKEVGEPKAAPELLVYPLDGQLLPSRSQLAAGSSVKAEGRAVATQQNVLTQDSLPAGRYVLMIRYDGINNWERKSVLVRVR